MDELQFRELIAQNLINYRKANNLTQQDVALRLNYSDKAVSKWERGESVPDAYTLSRIADLYGVSIDALCGKKEDEIVKIDNRKTIRMFITALSCGLAWAIAVLVFILFTLIPAFEFNHEWLILIYAIPVSFIVLTVFSAMWFGLATRCISVSGIVIGAALSIHLTLGLYIAKAWLIYVLALALEILVILWYTMFRIKKLNDK